MARRSRVLLVARQVVAVEPMLKWLCARGCECQVACSVREALGLLDSCAFDLVLSELNLPDGSASRLTPALVGSATSLFVYFLVEDGCWWLPTIERGEKCTAAGALRPSELAGVLARILEENGVSTGNTAGTAQAPDSPIALSPHPSSKSGRSSID